MKYKIILLNFRDPKEGAAWNPFSYQYRIYKEGNADMLGIFDKQCNFNKEHYVDRLVTKTYSKVEIIQNKNSANQALFLFSWF